MVLTGLESSENSIAMFIKGGKVQKSEKMLHLTSNKVSAVDGPW